MLTSQFSSAMLLSTFSRVFLSSFCFSLVFFWYSTWFSFSFSYLALIHSAWYFPIASSRFFLIDLWVTTYLKAYNGACSSILLWRHLCLFFAVGPIAVVKSENINPILYWTPRLVRAFNMSLLYSIRHWSNVTLHYKPILVFLGSWKRFNLTLIETPALLSPVPQRAKKQLLSICSKVSSVKTLDLACKKGLFMGTLLVCCYIYCYP